MTGATPQNYREKLRRPEPRSILTSLLKQVSPLPSSPSLTTPSAPSQRSSVAVTRASSSSSSSSSPPSISSSSAEADWSEMAAPQVKLRPFTGQEEATSWWQDFQDFVALFNYNADKQCRLFPFYLEAAAKVWHQDLAEETKRDAKLLEAAFKSRFGKPKAFDVSLLQMAQTSDETIPGFICRVQKATRNQDLPPSVIVAVAVNGLRQSIRQWVVNKEPTTLEEVRHHAVLAEKSQTGSKASDVNMAAKVEQLSDLVATLITKSEAPTVEAAAVPAAKHQQQHHHQQQQQQQQQRFQSLPGQHHPQQRLSQRRGHFSSQQPLLPPSYPQQGYQQQSRNNFYQRRPSYQQHGYQQQPQNNYYQSPQQRCRGCGGVWLPTAWV